MKKIILTIISLFFAMHLFAESEFKLKNVPKDFIGTYVPVMLEVLVEDYMSYEKALNTIAPSHYDILLLQEDICYSQVRFSDGYAVQSKDFEKWSFVENGNEKFILDENGLSYRKISNKYGEEGYTAFKNNILSIIFVDVLDNKNISIKDGLIKIYDKEYKFFLYPSYTDDYGAICLSNSYILKIEGLSANIYATERVGHWENKRTNEIVQTIPLFYWNDKNFNELELYKYENSKKDLRLLRNLIYAKHGYKFKSEDLKEIFSAFDWYKENPNFSEDDFSYYEKHLIEKIQQYEKDLEGK